MHKVLTTLAFVLLLSSPAYSQQRAVDDDGRTPVATGRKEANAEATIIVKPDGSAYSFVDEASTPVFETSVNNTKWQAVSGGGCYTSVFLANSGTSRVYVRGWNLASGSVVVGTTTTSIIFDAFIEPGAEGTVPAGSCATFTTAFTLAATATKGGNGAVTAGTVTVGVFYKLNP